MGMVDRLLDAAVNLYERRAEGVWVAIFAPLPLVCAPFYVQAMRTGAGEQVHWSILVVGLVLFVVSLMYAMTKCDVLISAMSVLVAVVLGGAVEFGGAGAIPSALLMCAAMLAGAFAARTATNGLFARLKAREGEQARIVTELVRSTQQAKCAECHCKRFCAFQPGGVADQYTTGSAMRSVD